MAQCHERSQDRVVFKVCCDHVKPARVLFHKSMDKDIQGVGGVLGEYYMIGIFCPQQATDTLPGLGGVIPDIMKG